MPRSARPERNRKVRLLAASLIMGLATLSVVVLPVRVASAATDVVTTCSGDATVPGSLPYEVDNAASGDTISFGVGMSCPATSPITLASTLEITKTLAIDGPGNGLVVVSGGGFYMPGSTVDISDLSFESLGFYSDAGGTLTLSNSTLSHLQGINIEDGNTNVTDSTITDSSSPYGGAIFGYFGTVNVTDSTLSGNSAGYVGGAIDNEGGVLNVTDSTLSGNAGNVGGAIGNTYGGTVNVSDSTLFDNTSIVEGGGGIFSNGGTVTISNSTLANNSAPSGNNSDLEGGGGIFNNGGTVSVEATIVADSTSGGDCSGLITDAGYNLADDDTCGLSGSSLSDTPAGLDTSGLQDNRGQTQTIALEPGSAAMGHVADASICSGADQRGVERPTPCDIGAYQTVTNAQLLCDSYGGGFGDNNETFGSWPIILWTCDGIPYGSNLQDEINGLVDACYADGGTGWGSSGRDATQLEYFTCGQTPLLSQTIRFTSTPPLYATPGGGAYVPTATGGGSGNPVVITVDASSSAVCSISTGVVAFIGDGTCTLDANQSWRRRLQSGSPSPTRVQRQAAPSSHRQPEHGDSDHRLPLLIHRHHSRDSRAVHHREGYAAEGPQVHQQRRRHSHDFRHPEEEGRETPDHHGHFRKWCVQVRRESDVHPDSQSKMTPREGIVRAPTRTRSFRLIVAYLVIGAFTVIATSIPAQIASATKIKKPEAPTELKAVGVNLAIGVSWTAPASDGGSDITGYVVTANPGHDSCTTTGVTYCTVTGLTDGRRYVISASAINAKGNGKASKKIKVKPSKMQNCSYFGIDTNLQSCNLPAIDLSGFDLAGADLDSTDLGDSNLSNTNLEAADMQNANLAGAAFEGSNLSGSNLASADLASVTSGGITGTPTSLPSQWTLLAGYLIGPHSDLGGANLSGVDVGGADFNSADLNGADLDDADLTNADLFFVTSGGIIGTPTGLPLNWTLASGYLVGPGADLEDANLGSVDLAGDDIYNAYLLGANFDNADLDGANLGATNLADANLNDASLSDTYFYNAYLGDATLTGAYFGSADLQNAYLDGANLTEADLVNANLSDTTLTNANLADASLSNVSSGGITGTPSTLPLGWDVQGGYLIGPGANLSDAQLAGVAYLFEADLEGTNLSNADLSGDVLESANLSAANLNGANLSNANLGTANLTNATLTGADVNGVVWVDATCPDGTNSNNDGDTCVNNLTP